jgi:ubiquitin-protein ligase
MAGLTPEQLNNRLRYDYEVAMQMHCPVMSLTAYRSADDLKARRNPITSKDQGHLAMHYLVDYKITTLIGPDRFSDRTLVQFNMLDNGDYPYKPPSCYVVDSEMPWSPHFKKNAPICIGEIWKDAGGKILLGHLLIHIAKLLNFDEVAREPGYVGWNAEAIKYWRSKMKEQPITPGFGYPALPTWVTHGEVVIEQPASRSTFKPAARQVNVEPQPGSFLVKPTTPAGFRPKPAAPDNFHFKPKGS